MADTAGANPFGRPSAPSESAENPFGAPSAPSDSPQNPFAAADDSSTTSLSPALGRPPDDAPSGLALGRASLALDYASDAGAWIPPNPFKFCVVFQIHALRGLPADAERESLVCELHVGAEKLSLPLHPARGTWSATVSRAADLGDNDGEAAASSSNLFFLFTRRGGHVGWCEGWNPRWAGPDGAWGFQNRAVFDRHGSTLRQIGKGGVRGIAEGGSLV